MMTDVSCPYCGAENEINHDDGYGYEEDKTHKQECSECMKTFTYTTTLIFMYESSEAPCLNDSEHSYKPTVTYPRQRTRMRCIWCGTERQCTKEEKKTLGYWKDGEFVL